VDREIAAKRNGRAATRAHSKVGNATLSALQFGASLFPALATRGRKTVSRVLAHRQSKASCRVHHARCRDARSRCESHAMTIEEAKRKLPLPAVMYRLGLGEHAKKSAKCPFHDDQHNSFSIWCNEVGQWLWKCHAGCGEGDEITFLEVHRRVSNSDAIKLFLELAGADEATRPPLKQESTVRLEWCVRSSIR
jgi:hypothetical protein